LNSHNLLEVTVVSHSSQQKSSPVEQVKQRDRNNDAYTPHSASSLHIVTHYEVRLHGKAVILVPVWQFIW